MAENTVLNKKLMIVSLILAVLAVALFYLRDASQRKKYQGDVVQILQWRRDLGSGAEISELDTSPVDTKSSLMNLKDVVRNDNKSMVTGQNVIRRVYKGDPVYYNDFLETARGTPADKITPGLRGFTLRVDPNYTPGDMLRVGGRVDVLGMVRLKNKPEKTYTLVQNLRVLVIGGRGPRDDEPLMSKKGRRHDPGMRVYRSITVEVKPKLAEQLADLLPRVLGKVWLTVRNPSDAPKPKKGIYEDYMKGRAINPDVMSILNQPLPDKRMSPD